ncbi:MAG: 4Fe-4S dicluster domain-containing protein [Acidobacteriota bacterium]
MSGKVFIENLTSALEKLSETMDVWVPAASGENGWGVEFQPYRPGMTPILDRQSTILPKKVVFPQVEALLRFEYKKDPENPAKARIELDDEPRVKPALVFGARPCDVKGFAVFDQVFKNGPYQDGYYEKRRENTLFATLVCREGDSACFCSSVGSGPADMDGSDFRLTPVEGGFVIEDLSERAAPLMDRFGAPATDGQATAAQKVQDEAAAQQIGDLDIEGCVEAFKGRFTDLDFWREQVGQCLSCGICTYSCPTCYCFTITDETKGLKGERLRSWDSCMFNHYTQEASGHNPRPTKLERYRNRVGHKFSYFPERYNGEIACCGCGRCIRSCPSSIDIRKVVKSLKEKKSDACA